MITLSKKKKKLIMISTVYKNQNKFLKLFVDDNHYDINEYLFAH